jgi:hypothetical protein
MSGKGRQFLDDELRPSAADGVLDGGGIQGISHHRFGSQGAQGLRSEIRTGHADDRVAGSHQLRHERSADSSARAGDKHSHLYLLARIPAARPVALLTCEVVIRAELVSIQVCPGLCF